MILRKRLETISEPKNKIVNLIYIFYTFLGKLYIAYWKQCAFLSSSSSALCNDWVMTPCMFTLSRLDFIPWGPECAPQQQMKVN